jgi:hypothetical protein
MGSELAGLYAECRGGDTLGRIARAEKWLEKHPEDARLLLALGRLCREQQLWGKAQSYFEASLACSQVRKPMSNWPPCSPSWVAAKNPTRRIAARPRCAARGDQAQSLGLRKSV